MKIVCFSFLLPLAFAVPVAYESVQTVPIGPPSCPLIPLIDPFLGNGYPFFYPVPHPVPLHVIVQMLQAAEKKLDSVTEPAAPATVAVTTEQFALDSTENLTPTDNTPVTTKEAVVNLGGD